MDCTCGHDFFDHRASVLINHSGRVEECRFRDCDCMTFHEDTDN